MRAIFISAEGLILSLNVNVKDLYEKDEFEFYAPLTTSKYPLCLACKAYSCFDDRHRPNKKANELFKKENEYFGDIYIFLEDPEYSTDDDYEEDEIPKNPYHTFENLLTDVYNNNLVY